LTANISVPLEGITAIIGPNGSGKTTFLKLVHGLIDFDSGNYLPGADKLRSALVLHHTPLIRASVRTNLAIIRDAEDIHSISDADIDLALADVGLLNLAEQSALKLSAGERQRLSLARAKLQNSKTILLDEPTANLDPSSTDKMEIIIKKLAGQGSSIIFTSHNLAQVERLAKQIIFISNGSCSEVIDKDVFFKNPPSKDAERFLHHELGWL
jgi:tungstate transport system ATP-binding protein